MYSKQKNMNKLSLTLVIAGIALGVTLLGGLLFRGLFLDYVDNYEFGYMFDARTGDLYPLLEPAAMPMAEESTRWFDNYR